MHLWCKEYKIKNLRTLFVYTNINDSLNSMEILTWSSGNYVTPQRGSLQVAGLRLK